MFTECNGHLNEGKALCPSRNTRLERIPHALIHPIKHMTVTSTTHESRVAGNPHDPFYVHPGTDSIKIRYWLYLQVHLHVSMGVKLSQPTAPKEGFG